ncbi:mitochondrial acidic protein mam33 isoform X2 [Camellia sinensis]|uniref:mitochondrial acidic protein mam33 isoform X2 n=1 Tax=Camellia sinensis TaxID=4442 RepID=UPI001036140D|nr:mitochondrial acidic protein mam33 isoform X2 [Camellia sinensis]
MPRVTTLLRKGYKAIHDFDLLKALQSEIRHEQSSNHFQDNQSGSLGDFVLDWDSPQSQDVVLRKKCESGEEVAVSALLGPETYEGQSSFPREALMKVCVKKPGLSSILQFDCGAFGKGDGGSEFAIHNAYYIPSSTCLDSSIYKGPSFSSLDPHLQDELKNYLVAKGIEDMFTNFVLLHLHRKEIGQYVKWLHKLEEIVAVAPSE